MKCNERNNLGFSHGEPSAIEVRNMNIMAPYSPYVVVSHDGRFSKEMQSNQLANFFNHKLASQFIYGI